MTGTVQDLYEEEYYSVMISINHNNITVHVTLSPRWRCPRHQYDIEFTIFYGYYYNTYS